MYYNALAPALKKIVKEDYIEELFELNGKKVLNNEKIEVREIIPFQKNIFGQYK